MAKSSMPSSLVVRLDDQSKSYLKQAARLRGISIGEYVRTVTVAQARQEVLAARENTLVLAPHEQLAFWKALNGTPQLTEAQEQLGRIMRGEERS